MSIGLSPADYGATAIRAQLAARRSIRATNRPRESICPSEVDFPADREERARLGADGKWIYKLHVRAHQAPAGHGDVVERLEAVLVAHPDERVQRLAQRVADAGVVVAGAEVV